MSLSALSPLSGLGVSGVTVDTQRTVTLQQSPTTEYLSAPMQNVQYAQPMNGAGVQYISQGGGCEPPVLACPPKTYTKVQQVQVPQKAVCVPCGPEQPVAAPCPAPVQACPPQPCAQPVQACPPQQANYCPPQACATSSHWSGWGALGQFLLWFIILTILFWLVYYSLHPGFVMVPGTNTVDTARVLLAAVITAIVIILIVWLIWALVSRC